MWSGRGVGTGLAKLAETKASIYKGESLPGQCDGRVGPVEANKVHYSLYPECHIESRLDTAPCC